MTISAKHDKILQHNGTLTMGTLNNLLICNTPRAMQSFAEAACVVVLQSVTVCCSKFQ